MNEKIFAKKFAGILELGRFWNRVQNPAQITIEFTSCHKVKQGCALLVSGSGITLLPFPGVNLALPCEDN